MTTLIQLEYHLYWMNGAASNEWELQRKQLNIPLIQHGKENQLKSIEGMVGFDSIYLWTHDVLFYVSLVSLYSWVSLLPNVTSNFFLCFPGFNMTLRVTARLLVNNIIFPMRPLSKAGFSTKDALIHPLLIKFWLPNVNHFKFSLVYWSKYYNKEL